MKKLSLFLFLILLIAVIGVELFIPSTLEVVRVVPARCRAIGAFPFLSNEHKWKAWWPDHLAAGGGDMGFRIEGLSYQNVDIGIRDGRQEWPSKLSLLPTVIKDSTLLQWKTVLRSGWNPVERIRRYREANRLAGVMDDILLHASEFLGRKENIYGVDVREIIGVDTLVEVTRTVTMGLPTDEDIYVQIGRLTNHIREAHVTQTGYPMVNITPSAEQPGAYRLMVALPIGAMVANKGDFFFMRLVPGKYLVGDVKGGDAAVAAAIAGMKDYIRDYERTVMAIPFQSLITDRMHEPDSSKWSTRIWFPVF